MAAVIPTTTPALLSQITPTIPSLVDYVKAIKRDTTVYVKRIDKLEGKNIVTLSTGFSYFIGADNKWKVYYDAGGNLFPVFYN